jgi:uncharacterized protein YqfB (UPF0267 family)
MSKSPWACAALITAAIAAGCGSGSSPKAATTFPAVLPTGTPPTATAANEELKVSPASYAAITAGTKTSTTRKGFRAITTGPLKINDVKDSMTITVTSVDHKTFGTLTEDDAKTDGTKTLDALKAELVKNYPGMTDVDPVTVIRFVVPPK